MRLNNLMKGVASAATIAGLAATLGATLAQAQDSGADKKYKIYLAMSYSGNSWQSEAANIVKALAKTPPYDKQVELTEVISGTDPQAQISAYESMIAGRRRRRHQLPDLRPPR